MKQKFSNRHLALYSIIIVQHLLKASLINYYRNSIYVVSVNILFISDDNKPGLGIEIKMNIDINFSINVIHVLNIDINFNIIETHVLNIDINFDISKFRF